MGPIRFTISNE